MSNRNMSAWVTAAVMFALAGQAQAAGALELDLVSLTFEYSATNPDAEPGEVIGSITIFDGTGSRLTMQKYDLGTDGALGGEGPAADTLVDLAKIDLSLYFDALFEADVIRLGANDYLIESTDFAVTDTESTLASPVLSGEFASDYIDLTMGMFAFAGPLVPSAGSDSLLLNPAGPDWVFKGLAADTPPFPDEDGVTGWVSLMDDRSMFSTGRLGEFHFAGFQATDLDDFFSTGQLSLSGDIKVSMTPEPTSVILLAIGATVLAWRRRSA